jgi:hypothetical protein
MAVVGSDSPVQEDEGGEVYCGMAKESPASKRIEIADAIMMLLLRIDLALWYSSQSLLRIMGGLQRWVCSLRLG